MKLLALLLVFAIPGHSQVIPVNSSYVDFSGGLNNDTASVYIDKNESPDLLNVVIDEPLGSLSQRKGYQVCGYLPSGNNITNIFSYTKINGSKNLIVTDNESVWQTADCQTFTLIVTGLSVNSTPRFATIKDNLWIVNGVSSPVVWTGSVASVLDGVGGRPNAPASRYIAWWKNRVWLGNTPTDPSSVYFSAVASPEGAALDPATSTGAWTNTNNLVYFNRGDGSPLYGLKVYRDDLFGIKETGLSRLVFQDEYNVNVVKNVTSIGSKFYESFVEMDDGFLRYVGRDGIYKFDGSTIKRISSKWDNTFKTFQQPNMGDQLYNWNTAIAWATGTLGVDDSDAYSGLYQTQIVGTKDYPNGIVLMQRQKIDPTYSYASGAAFPNMGAESGDFSGTISSINFINTDTEHQWGTRAWKTTCGDTDQLGYPILTLYDKTGNVLATFNGNKTAGSISGPSYTQLAPITSNNLTSQVYVSVHVRVIGPSPNFTVCESTLTTSLFTPTWYPTIISGNIYSWNTTVNMWYQAKGTGQNRYWVIDFDESYDWWNGQPQAHAQTYVSKKYKATGLAKWLNFTASQIDNGGTISYKVATATSSTALDIATFTAINSGDYVSTGTDPWFQFKAAMSTTSRFISPIINSIRIDYLTGTMTKSLLSGTAYKSRYWVATSTTTGGLYNDAVVIESKSPLGTHTVFDLPLSAMTVWNDNLYGAISNSSGIAHLDYTDTDNGKAIRSYWNSRDEVYDAPLYFKSINKDIVDYSASPANANLLIGISDDFGTTYREKPLNTGLSINPRNTKNINLDANRALQFRSRVFNNTLNSGFTIYGLHSYGTANQFMGN